MLLKKKLYICEYMYLADHWKGQHHKDVFLSKFMYLFS